MANWTSVKLSDLMRQKTLRMDAKYWIQKALLKKRKKELEKRRNIMWRKTIEWLDWNDARNTFPKWLWVMNGVVIGFAILVIIFVP